MATDKELERKVRVNTVIGLKRRLESQPEDCVTTAQMYLKYRGYVFSHAPSQKDILKALLLELIQLEMEKAIAALPDAVPKVEAND